MIKAALYFTQISSEYGFETQIYNSMLKFTYSKRSAQASEMEENVLYN